MIYLYLDKAQAFNVAATVTDPDVLDRVCAQLRLEEVFDDGDVSPRMIVFRDEGDGLRCVAVEYHRPEEADAAWDRFWAMVKSAC